jgi:LysR family transcriptional regulator, transcriptional activator of the cysJI operon
VEIRQLQCFQAVVEEGGFKRATSRLHVTQPALSYQIKQLEQELDTSLFDRRPGGVSLTEAGRVLFQSTQGVFDAVRSAERAVHELRDGVVGEIRLGVTNSVGMYFLPQVLRSMRQTYPAAITTVWCRRDSNVVLNELLNNRLDLAIVADPRPDRRMRHETLFEDPFSLLCGPKHPLYGKARVRATELKGLQFISISPELPTGAMVNKYLARVGVSIQSVVSSDNIEIVRRMVEVGLGVTLLPNMFLGELDLHGGKPDGRLSSSAIEPSLARRISLVTWRQCSMSRAVSVFVAELRRHACEWENCTTSGPA